MKVNFQKIFVAFSAVCVMSCFAVPVSADDYFDTGYRSEYGNTLETFMNDLGVYLNGEITIDEFLERSNGLYNESRDEFVDRLGIELVVDITDSIANGIMDNIAKAEQAVKDVLNPYQTTQSESTTDLQGYGALAVFYPYSTDNDMVFYYYTSTYGTYSVDDNGKYTIYGDGAGKRDYYYKDVLKDTTSYTGSYTWMGYKATFYGDWRNPDNIEESLPTDDEFVDMPVYDFSKLTDSELEQLLNEVDETLKRENPDLSTMEGLLESIYYRLGMLDSDNDNALLSQVITAIQFSSGELKIVLEEIRDSLTDGVPGDNSDLAEKLEKMITTDDFIIDEEAYRNYSTVLKLRLQEKFVFAEQLKELVTYTFNSYSNSSKNPQFELKYNNKSYSMDFSMFDNYIDEFRFILAAFIYISYAYCTYRKIPSYINGGDNL